MCPNHDKLFDQGWITFDDSGKMCISKKIGSDNRNRLFLQEDMKLKLTNGNQKYLEYHRKYIFKDNAKAQGLEAFLLRKRNLTGRIFMKNNSIYHGSNTAVENPRILINGHYKDFGYGFYCTNIEKQAKRWALETIHFEGSEVL